MSYENFGSLAGLEQEIRNIPEIAYYLTTILGVINFSPRNSSYKERPYFNHAKALKWAAPLFALILAGCSSGKEVIPATPPKPAIAREIEFANKDQDNDIISPDVQATYDARSISPAFDQDNDEELSLAPEFKEEIGIPAIVQQGEVGILSVANRMEIAQNKWDIVVLVRNDVAIKAFSQDYLRDENTPNENTTIFENDKLIFMSNSNFDNAEFTIAAENIYINP